MESVHIHSINSSFEVKFKSQLRTRGPSYKSIKRTLVAKNKHLHNYRDRT